MINYNDGWTPSSIHIQVDSSIVKNNIISHTNWYRHQQISSSVCNVNMKAALLVWSGNLHSGAVSNVMVNDIIGVSQNNYVTS